MASRLSATRYKVRPAIVPATASAAILAYRRGADGAGGGGVASFAVGLDIPASRARPGLAGVIRPARGRGLVRSVRARRPPTGRPRLRGRVRARAGGRTPSRGRRG